MPNVLHIINQKGYRTTATLLFFYGHEMINVYPGIVLIGIILPGLTRKDIEQLSKGFFHGSKS